MHTKSQEAQILSNEEVWKDIPGHEGMYQASTLGRIRSLTRYVNHPAGGLKIVHGRVLSPISKTNGYVTVCISRKTPALIHRLIAQTFIPNPQNKPCVNHKNGNKTDNRIDNLEWVTYSENEKYSWDFLGKTPNNGCFKKGSIPFNIQRVLKFSKEGEFITQYESATEAARCHNTTQGRVSTNCRMETKTCKGFVFRYEKDCIILPNGKRVAEYSLIEKAS